MDFQSRVRAIVADAIKKHSILDHNDDASSGSSDRSGVWDLVPGDVIDELLKRLGDIRAEILKEVEKLVEEAVTDCQSECGDGGKIQHLMDCCKVVMEKIASLERWKSTEILSRGLL